MDTMNINTNNINTSYNLEDNSYDYNYEYNSSIEDRNIIDFSTITKRAYMRKYKEWKRYYSEELNQLYTILLNTLSYYNYTGYKPHYDKFCSYIYNNTYSEIELRKNNYYKPLI